MTLKLILILTNNEIEIITIITNIYIKIYIQMYNTILI